MTSEYEVYLNGDGALAQSVLGVSHKLDPGTSGFGSW
jgi:hypothetical protein